MSRSLPSPRIHRVAPLLCAAVAWAAPLTAHAQQTEAIALNWVRGEGAEACASGKQLQTDLQRLLETESVPSAPLVIEGAITSAAQGGFAARLRVLSQDGDTLLGTRELLSSEQDCAKVTPALLLVLSVLVELGTRAAVANVDEHPVVVATVDVEEPPPRVPAPNPPPAQSRWHARVGAALALSAGLTPDASLGPQLAVQLVSPWRLALALRTGYWAAGRTALSSPNARAAGVYFHAITNDLALCLPLELAHELALSTCWGATLLFRKAHTYQLSDAPDSLRTTVGAHALLELRYALHERWFVAVDATLLSFRKRDSYSYRDVQGNVRPVFRAGHLASVFALALGVRL